MLALTPEQPLLRQLSNAGIEFDQKLQYALSIAASNPNLEPEDVGFPDSYLTLALYRINTILTRIITLDESRLNIFHDYKKAPGCSVDQVRPGYRLCNVLDRAAELAAPSQTIGVGHYLRAIVSLTLDTEAEDLSWLGFNGQVSHKTFSAETLLWALDHTAWTPINDAPELRSILEILDAREPVEDVQYLLTFADNRVVFRPTSVLDSYPMQTDHGHNVQRLAVLSHFQDQYVGILPSELLELEDLINNLRTREADLQRFFEDHPYFLRKWEFRDVYPQVYLTREDQGPLIPDFMLIDAALQQAILLDLKLPHKRIVVGKKDRMKFSSAVEDAKAQLLQYRDWFDDKHNRQKLKERFGIEIYKPRIAVLIGRRSEFKSEFERQLLVSRNADFEVCTYDDIVTFAERRLLLVKNAPRP
jgi:hypothetical protein